MAPLVVLGLFRPRLWVASILDLDLVALRAQGIRGIMLDFDNTLLPYGATAVPAEVRRWVAQARDGGFALALVTNNRSRRMRALAAEMALPIASGWMKPATSMFRRALALMGTGPAETALVGDQVLTDILGGNRLGLYTVLVSPLGNREFVTTRLVNRTIERAILRVLRLPGPPRRRSV